MEGFFMGQRYVRQKLKALGAFLLILVLLPYVVSVFVNGADIKAGTEMEGTYVRVKIRAGEEETVKDVPWSEYFLGVLAKEMPETYEEEALKAQAVLVRTKLYQALESEEEPVLSEEWLTGEELKKKWDADDYTKYYEKYAKAVTETGNQVLFYNDTYAFTPFHKSSNGSVRNAQEVLGSGDYPYLVQKKCPLDKEAEDEMQVHTFTYQEIQEKCRDFLVAEEKETAQKGYEFSDFEIQAYDSAGYVQTLRIGSTICTGDQFRDALSLPSSAFSLKDSDGKLKITTTGKGHGLGMSQWTANEMAKEGKTYEEILSYFFEGTNLTDGGEIFSKLE